MVDSITVSLLSFCFQFDCIDDVLCRTKAPVATASHWNVLEIRSERVSVDSNGGDSNRKPHRKSPLSTFVNRHHLCGKSGRDGFFCGKVRIIFKNFFNFFFKLLHRRQSSKTNEMNHKQWNTNAKPKKVQNTNTIGRSGWIESEKKAWERFRNYHPFGTHNHHQLGRCCFFSPFRIINRHFM